jgi:hypothetical protein
VPTLLELKKTADKQELHLDTLNGSVAACLRHDAVLNTKVSTLEEKSDETTRKQTEIENKTQKTTITLGTLIIIALVAAILDLISKVKII